MSTRLPLHLWLARLAVLVPLAIVSALTDAVERVTAKVNGGVERLYDRLDGRLGG